MKKINMIAAAIRSVTSDMLSRTRKELNFFFCAGPPIMQISKYQTLAMYNHNH